MDYENEVCPNCGARHSLTLSDTVYRHGIKSEIYTCQCCDHRFEMTEEKPTKPSSPAPIVETPRTEAPKVETPISPISAGDDTLLCQNVISKIFTIHSYNSPDNGWLGTGFCIGNGYVVTNAHVVEDDVTVPGSNEIRHVLCANVEVESSIDHRRYPARVVRYDDSRDLAILKVNAVLDSFALTEQSPIGTTIFSIGNSKGEGMRFTRGIISGYESINRFEFDFLCYTAMTTKGNSGGPIFNENGVVVGVTSMGMFELADCNFAIPVSELVAFAREIARDLNEDIRLELV